MARAIHVKKARKDNPAAGIKKGDEYWHVSFRSGRSSYTRYFTSPPRPSQLTQSEFLSNIYAAQEVIQDELQELKQGKLTFQELADIIDEQKEAVEEQGQECDDKFGNMPDSLQEGPTGALLQSRVDECNNTAQELDEAADTIRDLVENDEIPEEATDATARLATVKDKIEEAERVLEDIGWNME
jgi:uncharacterized protein YukE